VSVVSVVEMPCICSGVGGVAVYLSNRSQFRTNCILCIKLRVRYED
jgi:hypothetical protein